ncbi:MAG: thioredoxin family protein [Bdellovibrionales bacterium]|nr:thioredoxin family protein [Bdellovibrionales bacterium]
MAVSPPVCDFGWKAPAFTLPGTDGRDWSLDAVRGPKGTLVMFICNHCPFVKHIQHELVRLANDYIPRGIAFIAISSNDIQNYPEDAPEKMKALSESLGFPFPYLYDESQSVARAYDAACTPDFFLFDGSHRLIYRGQLDDSRPGSDTPVTGADLRNAIDALLNGEPIPENQLPSMGCNIKWKS